MERDRDNRPRTPTEQRDYDTVRRYMIPLWRKDGWRESEIAATLVSYSRNKVRTLARLVRKIEAIDAREGGTHA